MFIFFGNVTVDLRLQQQSEKCNIRITLYNITLLHNMPALSLFGYFVLKAAHSIFLDAVLISQVYLVICRIVVNLFYITDL